MISKIQVGDIAIGSSGRRCDVLRVEGDYVTIAHSTGEKRILINNVVRFERPLIRFEVGDLVGKIQSLGWWGRVTSQQKNGKVDILWDYDKHPTMEDIEHIKLR